MLAPARPQSNSPTPLLQEDATPTKQLFVEQQPKVAGVRAETAAAAAAAQSPVNVKSRRRPAPLRLGSSAQRPSLASLSAPLVVADDSKPELGDLGLGLGAHTLLRLPGLPA
jgi:hypothetical protein